jgi:Flp pilus assembly protein TadD
MATKEVMVTAPVIVLLYDRTFLTGSFRQALQYRWKLYVGLSLTWGLLIYLVLSTALVLRLDEAGTSSPWSYAWSYALTQPGVILHFLWLSVWPTPLCLDYGWPVAKTLGEILPSILVVGLLLAITAWGLIGRKNWSFLGAWFFLILSPTSSIVPLGDVAFEHRMYLPLAAVITAVVFYGYLARQSLVRHQLIPEPTAKILGVCLVVLTASAMGILTYQRNNDYKSHVSIWQDTVLKAPNNHRPHNNLGLALFNKRQIDDAIKHYLEALRIRPDFAEAHSNLGIALAQMGQLDEAMGHLLEAIMVEPNSEGAHYNLGLVLFNKGEIDDAIKHYLEALRIRPDFAEAHSNLGFALFNKGRIDDAIEHYLEALRIKPDTAEAHNNLGFALFNKGRIDDAIEHYLEALRIRPNFAVAHNNLRAALYRKRDLSTAVRH